MVAEVTLPERTRESHAGDRGALRVAGIAWEEQVTYFANAKIREFTADRFPVWAWHGEDVFYGLPVYGEVAVKVARDMRGVWTTVDGRSYEPDATEEDLLRGFLKRRLPAAVRPVLCSKSCVYDMPPTVASSSTSYGPSPDRARDRCRPRSEVRVPHRT
jgi:hypothetical protein